MLLGPRMNYFEKKPLLICLLFYNERWELNSKLPLTNYTDLFSPRGFPGNSEGKESACNARDPGLIPGSERFPGEGNTNPLQYFACRIPWTDQGVAKSQTQVSDKRFSPKFPRGDGHSGLPGFLPAADLRGGGVPRRLSCLGQKFLLFFLTQKVIWRVKEKPWPLLSLIYGFKNERVMVSGSSVWCPLVWSVCHTQRWAVLGSICHLTFTACLKWFSLFYFLDLSDTPPTSLSLCTWWL